MTYSITYTYNISDLEYGGKGTDEPLTVHGGDLQVVEVVRLQVGHHLVVDGVLHGHVRGQLAVAEDENLTEREREKSGVRERKFTLCCRRRKVNIESEKKL